jgi:hypothetical protein
MQQRFAEFVAGVGRYQVNISSNALILADDNHFGEYAHHNRQAVTVSEFLAHRWWYSTW